MSSIDLSSTQYAKKSRSLMNALVNLHGMKYVDFRKLVQIVMMILLSAEAVLESNLPRIVVFGDQSAGKR